MMLIDIGWPCSVYTELELEEQRGHFPAKTGLQFPDEQIGLKTLRRVPVEFDADECAVISR